MTDYFEVDFLGVETKKSGDAIALRYSQNGITTLHVIDGGYQETGEKLVEHINSYYGSPERIDHVVATHSDGDHVGGLRTVLDSFEIGTLWMNRPWIYASLLLGRFARFTSVEGLARRLRETYPQIAELEDFATERRIQISAPLQGVPIGACTVLAPSLGRYLDLVVASDKTPDERALAALLRQIATGPARVLALVRSFWGAEIFSTEETSAENEMSVVQYATLDGSRILFTGDAGRSGLSEAADYAQALGLRLPGVDCFQVPHHGSRRNVSTEILDRWLGTRLPQRPPLGSELFSAVISSAKADEDHPRKAVVRAMIHRGGRVVATEGTNIRHHSAGAPQRGWGSASPLPYPEEQEE